MSGATSFDVSERAPSRRAHPLFGFPERAPSRGRWHAWRAELTVIALAAGAFPLLLAAHLHSLGQPTGDDWSYFASLANLTQHGTLNLNHWASVFELGQLVLVCPLYLAFGVHPVLAVLWVWAVGMVGLFATAWLARRCGLSRRTVLTMLVTLALCPLYAGLSTTFMTDVPSFTAMMVALCLWAACTDAERFEAKRWAALGMVTLAFTIREPAVLAAVPILGEPIVHAVRRRAPGPRLRRLFVGAGMWCVAIAALWLWRNGLPTSTKSPLFLSASPAVQPWLSGWLPAMLGLFTLPVLLLTRPWDLVPHLMRLRRRRALFIVAVTAGLPGLGLLGLAASNPNNIQLGNIIAVDHYAPTSLRLLLSVIGLLSFSATVLIICGAYDERHRLRAASRRQMAGLSAFAVAYGIGLVGGSLVGLIMWDRYWFVVIPVGSIVLSKSGTFLRQIGGYTPSPRSMLRRILVASVLTVTTIFSLAVTIDGATLRAANFNFATGAMRLLPSAYGPQDVSVGLQWDGAAYAADPYVTFRSTGGGNYRLASHDAFGSYLWLQDAAIGSCAPFSVRSVTALAGDHGQVVALGPVTHGFFVAPQFALVRQDPGHQCVSYF